MVSLTIRSLFTSSNPSSIVPFLTDGSLDFRHQQSYRGGHEGMDHPLKDHIELLFYAVLVYLLESICRIAVHASSSRIFEFM